MWDDFGQVALTDWADPALLDVTLDELAERLFANMDERQPTIYRRRVIDGATLEVVGGELGVTRERIRQLQLKDREADRNICSEVSSPFTSAPLARGGPAIVSWRHRARRAATSHASGIGQESERG